jgi:DNA-binding NtrC family response regulator
MASMSHLTQSETQSDQGSVRSESTPSHRRSPLRVLFVHRDADAIDCCLQELNKAQFTVSADFVLNLAQCTERLHSQSYDVVVVEYPSPSWKGSQALQLLHQTVQEIPLLFATTAMGSESIAQPTVDGAFDHAEREHLAQLPMAVRRVLNEKKLRAELEEASSLRLGPKGAELQSRRNGQMLGTIFGPGGKRWMSVATQIARTG